MLSEELTARLEPDVNLKSTNQKTGFSFFLSATNDSLMELQTFMNDKRKQNNVDPFELKMSYHGMVSVKSCGEVGMPHLGACSHASPRR